MNIPLTFAEQLSRALTTPTRSVLGLAGDLLMVSRDYGIQLVWQAGRCRVRLQNDGAPAWIEVPIRKSVVRAVLGRIAVLCNQRNPNSVSPYGGKGELLVGADTTTVMRVEFVNTPDEQSLKLVSLGNEGMHAMREAAFEDQCQEVAQLPGAKKVDGVCDPPLS